MRTIIEFPDGKVINLINGKTEDGYTEAEAISNATNKKNTQLPFKGLITCLGNISMLLVPYYLLRSIKKIPK